MRRGKHNGPGQPGWATPDTFDNLRWLGNPGEAQQATLARHP